MYSSSPSRIISRKHRGGLNVERWSVMSNIAIFDLDRTLIDSGRCLVDATRQTFEYAELSAPLICPLS